MGFKIPSEDAVTSVGYVSTGAFNAREVAENLGREFEESWTVEEKPFRSSYGDVFKVTITVEKQ